MPTATVTSQGRVTIPKAIRNFLKVKAGDLVDFVIDEKGRVLVLSATVDVQELKGLLRRPGRRPVTLRQMEAAIGSLGAKRR